MQRVKRGRPALAEPLEDRRLRSASMLADLNPGTGSSSPSAFASLGDREVFTTTAGPQGAAVWITDGTAAGTTLLKSISPTPRASNFTVVGNTLYFTAYDAAHGTELWKTDGTPGGTVLVTDLTPGAAGSNPFYLTPMGNELLFFARSPPSGTASYELYRTDGTAGGTVAVAGIQTDPNPVGGPTIAVAGTTVFVRITTPNDTELATVDPTSGTISLLRSFAAVPFDFTPVGSSLYFGVMNGNQPAVGLWRSDGTVAGTYRISPTIPGLVGSSGNNLVNAAGTLYFFGGDATYGGELWKSDGTAAGTALVKDINPGTGSSDVYAPIAALGSRAVFYAIDSAYHVQPWVSDGTAAGTVPLSTTPEARGSDTVVVSGSTAYFGFPDAVSGADLVRSDGTPAGTVVVARFPGGPAGVGLYHLTAGPAGTAYFSGADRTHGDEPWVAVPGGAAVLSAAADTATAVYLSPDPDGINLDVWQDSPTPGTGTPDEELLLSDMPGLSITGSTGDDTLTTAGTIPVPVTFAAGGGSDTITVAAGATLTLAGDPSAGGGTVVVNDAGALVFAAAAAGTGVNVRSVATLNLAAGATVTVATPARLADRAVLSLGSLPLNASFGLDLGGNDMVVASGSLAALSKLAAVGYAGGRWTGPELASSAAAVHPQHLTALGVIQNVTPAGTALYPTFDGVAVTASAVLVKYTDYGDANLDGVVNAADYSRIDAGFIGKLTGWANGDFNYDGTVDGSDYTLVDNAFNQQVAASSPVVAPAAATAAPVRPAVPVAVRSHAVAGRPLAVASHAGVPVRQQLISDDSHKRHKLLPAELDPSEAQRLDGLR